MQSTPIKQESFHPTTFFENAKTTTTSSASSSLSNDEKRKEPQVPPFDLFGESYIAGFFPNHYFAETEQMMLETGLRILSVQDIYRFAKEIVSEVVKKEIPLKICFVSNINEKPLIEKVCAYYKAENEHSHNKLIDVYYDSASGKSIWQFELRMNDENFFLWHADPNIDDISTKRKFDPLFNIREYYKQDIYEHTKDVFDWRGYTPEICVIDDDSEQMNFNQLEKMNFEDLPKIKNDWNLLSAGEKTDHLIKMVSFFYAKNVLATTLEEKQKTHENMGPYTPATFRACPPKVRKSIFAFSPLLFNMAYRGFVQKIQTQYDEISRDAIVDAMESKSSDQQNMQFQNDDTQQTTTTSHNEMIDDKKLSACNDESLEKIEKLTSIQKNLRRKSGKLSKKTGKNANISQKNKFNLVSKYHEIIEENKHKNDGVAKIREIKKVIEDNMIEDGPVQLIIRTLSFENWKISVIDIRDMHNVGMLKMLSPLLVLEDFFISEKLKLPSEFRTNHEIVDFEKPPHDKMRSELNKIHKTDLIQVFSTNKKSQYPREIKKYMSRKNKYDNPFNRISSQLKGVLCSNDNQNNTNMTTIRAALPNVLKAMSLHALVASLLRSVDMTQMTRRRKCKRFGKEKLKGYEVLPNLYAYNNLRVKNNIGTFPIIYDATRVQQIGGPPEWSNYPLFGYLEDRSEQQTKTKKKTSRKRKRNQSTSARKRKSNQCSASSSMQSKMKQNGEYQKRDSADDELESEKEYLLEKAKNKTYDNPMHLIKTVYPSAKFDWANDSDVSSSSSDDDDENSDESDSNGNFEEMMNSITDERKKQKTMHIDLASKCKTLEDDIDNIKDFINVWKESEISVREYLQNCEKELEELKNKI